MNLTLTRIMRPGATFGVLSTEDYPLCVTLELPWQNNDPNVSCIPAGTYQVQQFESPKHGQVWEIMNVLGRSDILLHEGNFASDSRGCILCASHFSGSGPAILDSDITIAFLRGILPAEFTLTITESL